MEARSQTRTRVKGLEPFRISAVRIIEFIAGICTALSGLAIWLHILITDMANGAEFKLADVEVFLMFMVPGFLVAFGSYLQTRRRKEWAAVIVLIGALLNVWFVGVNAGIVFFGLSSDVFGRSLILMDFAFVLMTVIGAGINAITSSTSGKQS